MKKILKVMMILILLTVAAGLGILTFQYNSFVPRAVDAPVSDADLRYFSETWEDCRKGFGAAARSLPESYGVKVGEVKVASPSGEALAMDYCHIPAQKASKRLFILTSGLHGVEGFVGSAVQQMFLKEVLPGLDLDEMGVLIVHGINAYGFKHRRRVSENNIDLNRNCSVDTGLYDSVNQGYTVLNPWLNPDDPVKVRGFKNLFFMARAAGQIAARGMADFRQATVQGQYQFEKGIFYGGNALDDPIRALTPLIRETAGPYDAVFCIDLHTGYGERGTMHLFPNPMEEGPDKEMIRSVFEGFPIDWGDEEDFYTITGELVSYVGAVMPEKHYLTMTFEFGTLDSQTTFGLVTSLQRIMLENQGAHHGFASEKDEARTRALFSEMFYPTAPAWRTKAVGDARAVLKTIIPRYTGLAL